MPEQPQAPEQSRTGLRLADAESIAPGELETNTGGTITDATEPAQAAQVLAGPHQPALDALAAHYRAIIEGVGEDPTREGVVKTPMRAATAMSFLTQGYRQDLHTILNGAIFEEENNQMVLLRDIEFYSQCEHHLLPFFGKCHVAYIPSGKIVGVSKIARIVDMFARRLQVQERMTNQIADAMEEALQPQGVAVVAEGTHLCMVMRGVQKQHSTMTTSAMRGVFNNLQTRMEMLTLIRDSR